MSEKELKRELDRQSDLVMKRDCKVRGIGKHSGDRKGEISHLYLSNLLLAHQNASHAAI